MNLRMKTANVKFIQSRELIKKRKRDHENEDFNLIGNSKHQKLKIKGKN